MSYRENLYTFIRVYHLGSQQKAALELNLTQPAISQHIKILEHYLGRKLFSKSGRSLVPTPVAHQLALEVRDTFSKLDTVMQHIKKDKTQLGGIVYLGGITEFFAKTIVPSLKSLSDYDIQIRFEADHATLLQRLLNGEIDLAQFTTHVVHPNVVVEKFFNQEWVLVGHPEFLSKLSIKQIKNNVITSLNSIPWVAYDESLLFITEYFQSVFNQPFDAQVKLLVRDLWAILEAVAAGIGVSVLPLYFCREYIQNRKISVLYQPPSAPSHYFYLGWKHGALLDQKVNLVKQMIIPR